MNPPRKTRLLISASLILGLILLYPTLKKHLFTTNSPNPKNQTPTKSDRPLTTTSTRSHHSGLDPFDRPRRAKGTPRIGENSRIPTAIVRQLGLTDEQITAAETAIWQLREEIKQLALQNSSFEIDPSDQSMVIHITPFKNQADTLLSELKQTLTAQLGNHTASALFSYLDTENQFSAFGLHQVRIELEFKDKGREVFCNYHTPSAQWGGAQRIWLDSFQQPRILDNYDDAFDSLVTDHFQPLLQKEKDDREARIAAQIAAQKNTPPKSPNLPAIKIEPSSSSPYSSSFVVDLGLPVFSHETNKLTEHYQNQLTAHYTQSLRPEPHRSRPEDGYFVYSIRASEDYGEHLLQQAQSEFAATSRDISRLKSPVTYNPFPADLLGLGRDILLEVQKNPDGTIQKTIVHQHDGRTGEFISRGQSSAAEWLLETSGLH